MADFGKKILEMRNINKEFPGVKALVDVDLTVHEGEVHALVGENGAGKSTLIKIMMGVYQKTSGETYIDGNKVEIKNPIQARERGLGAVYQDVNLALHLSVGENFFMGKMPRTKLGLVDWNRVYSETKELLESLDIFVDPKMLIKNLPVAQQEMVAIAKIIQEKAKIVVFDEPTALLTNEETEQLFKLIRKLKSDGVGIIYISHRMEEIFTISDTVTVLKDGAWVNCLPVPETNEDQLIAMMVGRSIEDMYSIQHQKLGDVVLKIKDLKSEGRFEGINFEVKSGQIFGMFGLVGSGRTEIVRSIFGADQYDEGEIYINGKRSDIKSPQHGIKEGIALLPEDRKEQGLALKLSVGENTNIVTYPLISKMGVINDSIVKENAEKYKESLRIKTPSIHQKVKNLSGGNQQKVVISKWLCRGSQIFIFDEPTVGVDVGAKVEIYKLFEKLLAQGHTIIVVSSYLPEVMGLADQIMVMWEGKQMAILDRSEFGEETILKLASGIKKDKVEGDGYE